MKLESKVMVKDGALMKLRKIDDLINVKEADEYQLAQDFRSRVMKRLLPNLVVNLFKWNEEEEEDYDDEEDENDECQDDAG